MISSRVQAVVIIAYMYVVERKKKTLALQWFLPRYSVNTLIKADLKL